MLCANVKLSVGLTAGDKNISILHFSCRTSDTIFTGPANTCTCPLKAYAIKNIRE